MKKTILFLFIAISLLFYSCESVFDFGADGRVTNDEIFSDYLLTGKYLQTAYSYYPGTGASSAGGTFLASYTDEAQNAQDVVPGTSTVNYYNGNMSSNNNLLDG